MGTTQKQMGEGRDELETSQKQTGVIQKADEL
jgi:hypothetical protein